MLLSGVLGLHPTGTLLWSNFGAHFISTREKYASIVANFMSVPHLFPGASASAPYHIQISSSAFIVKKRNKNKAKMEMKRKLKGKRLNEKGRDPTV